MNKPIIILAGRLWSAAKIHTPDTGAKPFVEFTVKMTPRVWQGKTYFQKVYCRCYGPQAMEALPHLAADTLVTVTGEADAMVEQGKDGKSYANIRVTGNVAILEGEGATSTGTTPTPAPAPARQAPAAKTTTPQAEAMDDESVPF